MSPTAMPTRSRARRLLPLLGCGLLALAAACHDGPSGPTQSNGLDLLRAASLASDSLAPLGGGLGMLPMRLGAGVPMPVMPLSPTGMMGPGSSCAYSAATGRVECAPSTFNGITVESSFAFFDRDGRAQERFDALTTDKVEFWSHAVGTMTMPLRAPDGQTGGSLSVTMDRRDDRAMSNLLDPSGKRRMDGTAEGTESQTITTPRGTAKVDRSFADTTENLVMPAMTMGGMGPGTYAPIYPVSGRIVRVSHAVETPPGAAPRTVDLRAVTEFLTGGVARTTITVNGTTHVCTQDLTQPFARPNCS